VDIGVDVSGMWVCMSRYGCVDVVYVVLSFLAMDATLSMFFDAELLCVLCLPVRSVWNGCVNNPRRL
jgi:hypothetical protein